MKFDPKHYWRLSYGREGSGLSLVIHTLSALESRVHSRDGLMFPVVLLPNGLTVCTFAFPTLVQTRGMWEESIAEIIVVLESSGRYIYAQKPENKKDKLLTNGHLSPRAQVLPVPSNTAQDPSGCHARATMGPPCGLLWPCAAASRIQFPTLINHPT